MYGIYYFCCIGSLTPGVFSYYNLIRILCLFAYLVKFDTNISVNHPSSVKKTCSLNETKRTPVHSQMDNRAVYCTQHILILSETKLIAYLFVELLSTEALQSCVIVALS